MQIDRKKVDEIIDELITNYESENRTDTIDTSELDGLIVDHCEHDFSYRVSDDAPDEEKIEWLRRELDPKRAEVIKAMRRHPRFKQVNDEEFRLLMQRHRWTDDELKTISDNRHIPAATIKRMFFANKSDITIKAIQRKKDHLRGEDLARNNEPVEQWELDYIKDHIDDEIKSTNEHLSQHLQRKPDQIDAMRLRVRKSMNKGRKVFLPKLYEKKAEKNNSKIDRIAEMNAVLAAIATIKNIDPELIEEMRQTRQRFQDNPEIVAVYDWFKVPQAKMLHVKSAPKQLYDILRQRVELHNRGLRNTPPEKSVAVSTHQNNLLRLICGIRITSWKNLSIHDANTNLELKAVARALLEYCESPNGNLKARPNDKPL